MKKNKPIEIMCPTCGYKWVTKSKLLYATCPRCQRKVKIRELDGKLVKNE